LKAVVLAAGEGTRLRPFTNSRPKVMIPVANKPILHFVVKALVDSGVKDIVLVVGYKRERIMSYFGDGKAFGANIHYVVQEKQLGTAHALNAALSQVDGEFLMVAGDNLIDSRVVLDLLNKGKGPCVAVTTSETPSKYGVVTLEGEMVTGIVEKPQKKIGNIISTGMYRFSPDIFKLIERGISEGEGAITNILQGHLPKVQLRAVHTQGRWMDAVYPWDLIKLNSFAFDIEGQEVNGTVEAGAVLRGPVVIGAGTKIRSGTYIEGPVAIGEGSEIGPNVVITASTSIGDGVTIGPFSYIEESLISDNVSMASHAHLSHSVLDEGVRIGPGFRAPASSATTHVEHEYFHLKRVGSLVGERTAIGSGVTSAPGAIIGADCRIGDQTRVSGNLVDRSIVV
jgi:UDP-N-acetylglucosamine diphosphorylase / glucose-1-phosphate thymidylyltransferase / UDP-N-acetylgalactosamine diphosphorylase / glucosamine-1-phosphate N-acetyltransferase / galactosamine-1-phosphate N-acetyltransferase